MAYFAMTFSSTVAIFNGFDAFFPGHFSAKSFIPSYIDIPIFAILFMGYKFMKGTKIVRIEDMDLLSGKEEADELESMWEEPKPRNFIGKFLRSSFTSKQDINAFKQSGCGFDLHKLNWSDKSLKDLQYHRAEVYKQE
jgi:hypothetical protein